MPFRTRLRILALPLAALIVTLGGPRPLFAQPIPDQVIGATEPIANRFGASMDMHAGRLAISGRDGAHVYERRDGRWELVNRIRPEQGTAGVVVLHNDRLVMTETGSGVVIRRLVDDAWVPEAELERPAQHAGDGRFGHAVALSDRYCAVAAESTGERWGSVHIFERHADGWRFQRRITASKPALLDQFGVSLAIQGRWLAVGAASPELEGPGRVEVIDLGRPRAKPEPVQPPDGLEFGFMHHEVRFVGEDLLVGGYARQGAGVAVLYERDAGIWIPSFVFEGDTVFRPPFFGAFLDGADGVVVAAEAPFDPNQTGRVMVFTREADGWNRSAVAEFRSTVYMPILVATDGTHVVANTYSSGRVHEGSPPPTTGVVVWQLAGLRPLDVDRASRMTDAAFDALSMQQAEDLLRRVAQARSLAKDAGDELRQAEMKRVWDRIMVRFQREPAP